MRILALVLLCSVPALANDNPRPPEAPMRYPGVERLLKQHLEKVNRRAEREGTKTRS
jgi:hypothetical protein